MLSKLTKVIVAALVLSTTSIAMIGSASALDRYSEQGWFDRATSGGAGHHQGDTNGF